MDPSTFPDHDHKVYAQGASDNLINALAELTRYRREGPVCNWPFGDVEPVMLVAQALSLTAGIEYDTLEVQTDASITSYREGLGQLMAALHKFLSDHCEQPHPSYYSEPAPINQTVPPMVIDDSEVPF